MPCDHFSLVVPPSKFEPLIEWLVTSLSHLGFKEHMRPVPSVVGLGDTSPYFWLSSCLPEEVDEKAALALLKSTHVAFTAESTFFRY